HKPVASAAPATAAGRAAEAGRATAAPLAPPASLATSSPAPAPPAATKPAPPGLAEAQAAPPLPAAAPRVGSPGHSPAAPGRVGGPHSPPPRQPAKPVEFKTGDHVVYPTHGVGTVQGIESMSAAGHTLQVIVVTFDENRMTLRVPVNKAASSGLRKLATDGAMKDALDTLRGKARIKRTMWSRRAQEYEAKINSGDPVAIAEVVRDLHRNAGQPDQSFSERQIYEQAMDRLAAELAAIDRTDKVQATDKLLLHLKQG
ncbi:MAG: CarD family transcriptional regulator, partial [Paracraurococcus sp.]